nr:[protein-PII] uridylyltransferase [Cytophagales bacterium]
MQKMSETKVELVLGPDLAEAEIVRRLKEYLKSTFEKLRKVHLSEVGGLEGCRLRARMIDRLLTEVVTILPEAQGCELSELPICITAVGGYGREELNPFSDIDILILHPPQLLNQGKPSEMLTSISNGILYKLWDSGLKVGHAVRTVDQCVLQAKENMQSLTGLLEARFIVGDIRLFNQLEALILKKCIRGSEDAYMKMRLDDQEDRRSKHGGSPFLQTPNIKNGCGGLRDYQNLLWMSYFKFRERNLSQLVSRQAISEDECSKLKEAYDFLLKVRTELHYQENRPIDNLERACQHKIAKAFGYPQRSLVKLIEAFMKDYYIHVRNIYIISRSAERRLALLKSKKSLPTFKQVIESRQVSKKLNHIDGFIINNDIVECEDTNIFDGQPQRLMRLFLHIQKLGLNLHPTLEYAIRNHVEKLPDEFQSDPKVVETFLEILNQRGSVSRVLRLMHELGVLGRFLPEFGRMTCLVQHEFLHQYTADEHTLVCIEHLDKIWTAKEKPHVKYQELFLKFDQPFQIYLSLLLHDSGKASPERRHEEIGARLMQRVGKRFRLPRETTDRMAEVVHLHLLMPVVSQRRDLDDIAVIQEVASKIKSRRLLRLLTIHTFCDSMGTSSSLWNEFKDMLLWQLFHATYKVLEGDTQFLRQEEDELQKRIRKIRRIAQPLIPNQEIKAHIDSLPERYFTVNSEEEVFIDLQLVHRFLELQFSESENPLTPIVYWELKESRGYALVKVCTWNRKGFFAKLAGSIAVNGLTILSAQIYSRFDGIIIDTIIVVDATTGRIPNSKKRHQFEEMLEESLTSQVQFDTLLKKRGFKRSSSEIALEDVIESSIRIDNELSEQYTVIDVVTPDEPGLLYYISQKLSDLNLDIWLAKISTERGAAIDTFYITEVEGGKITDPEMIDVIQKAISDVFNSIKSLA